MKTLTSPFKLIEKSVDLFKKKENLTFLIKIYLPLIIFPVISIAFSYIPFFSKNINSGWFISLSTFVRVAYTLISIFVAISGIIAMSKVVGGENLTPKKVFAKAWKNYWKFLLLSLVLGLLYVLGFILLIVPGLLLVVWLAFSQFIFVEKQTGIKESLLRSKTLVKGMYWKIFGRLIVFWIFSILVEVVLGAIPFGIGSIFWALSLGLFVLPTYLLYKELSE